MAQDFIEISFVKVNFLVYDVRLGKVPFCLALNICHPETPIERTLLYRPVNSADLHCQTSIFLDTHVNFKPTINDYSHASFLGFRESSLQLSPVLPRFDKVVDSLFFCQVLYILQHALVFVVPMLFVPLAIF